MVIRWTPEASTNLEDIALRIAQDKPEVSLQTVRDIFQRIEQLIAFPSRGRAGREEGTRELVLSPLPYVVVYRVKDFAIEILQIWHGARQRRP